MQSDCRFVDVKRFPWEQQQTKIYCCCIKCIDRIGRIDIEAVFVIQFVCTPDQQCRQVFSDVPVVRFVSVDQCRPFDWTEKSHAVQLHLVGQQAGFDIQRTLVADQLCKSHGAELLDTTQIVHVRIATTMYHNFREARP